MLILLAVAVHMPPTELHRAEHPRDRRRRERVSASTLISLTIKGQGNAALEIN